MKKEKIFAVSAGVTLAVTCVFLSFAPPTEVHAEFGDLAGAVDYIEALEGEEAVAFGSSGGAVVAGTLLGVWMCTQNPIQLGSYYDMSSLSTYTCFYNWNGETKFAFVNIYTAENFTSSDGGYDIITSDDFDIRVETSLAATITSTWDNGQLNVGVLNYQGQGNQRWFDTKLHFDQVLSSNNAYTWGYWGRFGLATLNNPPEYANYTGAFPVKFGNDYPLYPVALDLRATSSGLGGQLDVSDPDLYINDVVRPWVIENYPDYIYLLPEAPVEPTETLDPSETMPGLPVIQLPTVPPPEYDLELPEKMLEGAGFWFTALTQVLDELGWLAIVIALAVIAIVLYYVF